MAAKSKKGAQKIKLIYKGDGKGNESKVTYYYTAKKSGSQIQAQKRINKNKYHPGLRKHVLFEEAKIK